MYLHSFCMQMTPNCIFKADILNTELIHVLHWIQSNNLTLNFKKTHYFVSCSNMMKQHDIIIKFGNQTLNVVNEATFLGVIIDNNLKWTTQINIMKTKISKAIGIVYNIRKQCSIDTLRQIYLSIV